MDRFVTKFDFSKLAKVSAAAITNATKPDKALVTAFVGGKIDLGHPAAKAYLKKKNVAVPEFRAAATTSVAAGIATEMDPLEFMHMSLGEILAKYGTLKEFKGVLDALKTMADISYKEMQAQEKRGEFIRRETVKTFIFGALEQLNLRLLRDVPKTAVARLASHLKTGGSREDAEMMFVTIISQSLQLVSDTTTRVLRTGA